MVEQQPIFGASRKDVQSEAHAPQEGLAAFQPPQLPGREKVVFDEFIEGLDAEMALKRRLRKVAPQDTVDLAVFPTALSLPASA